MTPIELLKDKLDEYSRALKKLEEMFRNDLISENTYHERKNNLIPKISTYKRAIAILSSCEL